MIQERDFEPFGELRNSGKLITCHYADLLGFDNPANICIGEANRKTVWTDCCSDGTRTGKWYGLPDFQTSGQVAQLCREGFPERAGEIAAHISGIPAPVAKSIRPRVVYGPSGQVQPLRLYGGNLMQAFGTVRKETSRNGAPTAYDIAFNVSANGRVSADEMAQRSFAALILADTLTKAGYPIRLRAIDCSRNGYHVGAGKWYDYLGAITLCDFGQVIDLGTIAAGSMALMCRFWGFLLQGHTKLKVSRGMGAAVVFATMPEPLQEPGLGTIWIDGISTREQALEFVANAAQKIDAGQTEIRR